MKKDYQKNAAFATTPVLPEAGSVVMAEIAEDVRGAARGGCGRRAAGDGRDDGR